jgi:Na+/proline symporter
MRKFIPHLILIFLSASVVAMAFLCPHPMSDENDFFKNFVNHELLNALGVILAITIASAGQLHLELNSIEREYNATDAFKKTRAGIVSAVYWMVGLFFLGILIVSIKPLVSKSAEIQTLFNGSALLVLVWNVLVLMSITRAVFKVKPR